MWWLGVVVVLVMGCARGPEMRPRGLRNAHRIEAIERKIAALEGKPYVPPAPAKPADDDLPAIRYRIQTLETQARRIETLEASLRTLETEVKRLRVEAALPPAK